MSSTENARAFIGLGSNLGDSMETLLLAWEALDQDAQIRCLAMSSPYVSAPVDMYSQHWFTNAVGEIRTSLSPIELLRKLLEVETLLGRVRKGGAFGYQDREIDLDILYIGDLQMNEPDLVLPHPHLQDRLFVLSPMAEIAGDFIDPRRETSVAELEKHLLEAIKAGTERKQEISRSSWPTDPQHHVERLRGAVA